MLLLLALLTTQTAWCAKKMWSWAIWSPDNTTLYFVRDRVDYTQETTYVENLGDDDKIIHDNIQAWQIADSQDTSYPSGAKNARWAETVAATCTKVVFTKSFNKARPLCCKGWFKDFKKLTTIEDINYLRTDDVTDMTRMFFGCKNLTSIDLSRFRTKNVTNMNGMFRGCAALTSLDLSFFRSNSLTDMTNMFCDCKNLTSVDLSSINTKNVTNMNGVFNGCRNLTTLDLSRFNTKKVTNMAKMFYSCTHLVSIYVDDAKWNTENVKNSKAMFTECKKLKGEDGSKVDKVVNATIAHTGPGGVLKRLAAAGIYTVNVATDIMNGTVEVSQPTADKGVGIYITVTPDAGYQLTEGSLTVMKSGTGSVDVFDSDNDYWFVMPADNVTVSATFELVAPIVSTYELTGNYVHFQVGGANVTEAAAGATVTVVADDGAVAPEGMQFTVMSDNSEDANYNKPVFVSDEVEIANDGTFTMPPAAVSVSREYEPKTYQLTGNNLEFFEEVYDEELNMNHTYPITEATYGQKVIVSADPMTFEGGKYHGGNYSSGQVTTFNAYETEGDKWFTMPACDVTVSAVLLDQNTLTIDLSSKTTTTITEETALYMTTMESYITWIDNDSYTFDMNLDGWADFLISGLDTEDYKATRLPEPDGTDGHEPLADNYAMALRTPGNPLPYKAVLFYIGKPTTVSSIFLYESTVVPNGYTLTTYDNQTVNVTLAERVFYKDGDWNTLCLPFDVTIAGSPLDGAGVEARTLESAEYADGGLTLNFSNPVTKIEAGKPYIIKWTKPAVYEAFNYSLANEATCSDLCFPVFQNVLLKNTDEPVEIEDIVSFTGTYKTLEFLSDDPDVEADDPSLLFLGAANTLYYPKTGARIGAFRAYFQLEGNIEAAELAATRLNFEEDETTSVNLTSNPSPKGEGSDYWYSLDGRKLNGKPSTKGIYINNGKKVFIK